MNPGVPQPPWDGKISFCTTCRNRLWQLEQTLASNLDALGDQHEISLVDYGSTDGLAPWVWANFRSQIEAGRLRFFEVRNPVHWNVARAKNLAHRIARGDYLFNLDADNWIGPDDIRMVRKAAGMGLPCQQSKNFGNGSFGRIGMPREVFFDLGGYDENLLPMAAQDINILERVKAIGFKLAKIPENQKPAVQNTYDHKMAEAGGDKSEDKAALDAFTEMAHINHAVARARVRYEGPRYLGGFASFKGLLDGKPVTIDGFNVIRSDETVLSMPPAAPRAPASGLAHEPASSAVPQS